ncbi:hypothetical protein IWW50_005395 [Coemansia erecta]|nr:hypothetical protein IWW50_005395 [Coemansia erecta]
MFKMTVMYQNKIVGIEKTSNSIVELLKKMTLEATADVNNIYVKVPATRLDILQECGITEYLAITFRYNQIPQVQNSKVMVGALYPLKK